MRALFEGSSLAGVLRLTPRERLLWRLEVYPPVKELAKRLFSALDTSCNRMVSVATLDFVMGRLQERFTLTARTYDFVEQVRAEQQRGGAASRGVDLATFTQFLATVVSRDRRKLPADAKWWVLHPHSRLLAAWVLLMRLLAVWCALPLGLLLLFRICAAAQLQCCARCR